MSDELPTLFSEEEIDVVIPKKDFKEAPPPPPPPGETFPESALEHFHPNLINRLTLLWGYPECHNLLDSLMVDSRGNRQGFRQEVLGELMFLHTILPPKVEASQWGGVNVKREWI
jgi:hypothetical protein